MERVIILLYSQGRKGNIYSSDKDARKGVEYEDYRYAL